MTTAQISAPFVPRRPAGENARTAESTSGTQKTMMWGRNLLMRVFVRSMTDPMRMSVKASTKQMAGRSARQ